MILHKRSNKDPVRSLRFVRQSV
ncbi:hypothetical protein [Citrobacter koseri]